MANFPATDGPARRSLEATLLVVSIAALAFNLRAAITSLPPVFPELQSGLHLSSAAITWLAATPVLCFGVFSGMAASLSRRFGEERVLFGALIGVSAGLLLRGAFPKALLFPGSIIALGSIAIMNVLLSSMIKRRWPERAGLLIGVYLTALSTGAVIASLVSVPLFNGSGGSIEETLGLWGLPAVAATLMWVTQLRYGPPPRRAVPAPAPLPNPASLADSASPANPVGLADSASPRPADSANPAGLASVGVHRHLLTWQVTGFMGLQSLLYYAAASWLPNLFRDRGDTATVAGVLLAVMGFGNLLTSLATPAIAHRVADQRLLVAPAVALTAIGLAGSLWAPLGSAVVWVLLLGMAQGASLGLGIFFTMARAPDPATAASLSSVAQSVGYLLSAAGPLAVGFLRTATGSWTVPVVLLLAVCVVEMAVGLLAGRDRMIPARFQHAPAPAADDGLHADNY